MDNPSCPVCPGVGRYLGVLGQVEHFRCQSCGMDFHHKDEEPREEPLYIGSAGRYADEMPERDFYEGDSPNY